MINNLYKFRAPISASLTLTISGLFEEDDLKILKCNAEKTQGTFSIFVYYFILLLGRHILSSLSGFWTQRDTVAW
jgi:hypothetical protein